jgi:exonuclease VII small subunit
MNTENMMYDAPVGDYEGMEESVPCCQRPSCVPREAECTGEPGETDLLIADLQQQLEKATAKAETYIDMYNAAYAEWKRSDATLARAVERVDQLTAKADAYEREGTSWKNKARQLGDKSFERYKQIRVLEQRLSEGWWTKLIRWVKNDWEYNIYEDYQR